MENIVCTICMSNVIEVIELECKHKFCKECLTTWLRKSLTCPCCRAIVSLSPLVVPQDFFKGYFRGAPLRVKEVGGVYYVRVYIKQHRWWLPELWVKFYSDNQLFGFIQELRLFEGLLESENGKPIPREQIERCRACNRFLTNVAAVMATHRASHCSQVNKRLLEPVN